MKELYEKFLNFMSKVSYDALLHVIIGMIVTGLFATINALAPFAFLFGVGAAIANEWYNKKQGKEINQTNFLSMSAGAFIMQILIWL